MDNSHLLNQLSFRRVCNLLPLGPGMPRLNPKHKSAAPWFLKNQKWFLNIELSCPMDKNPPANAWDTGLLPDPGRFHMPWSKKLLCHNYWAHPPEPCAPQEETPRPCNATKRRPHLLQLEKALAQKRRPSATKNKIKFWFIKSAMSFRHSTYGYTTKRIESGNIDICTPMLVAALFKIAKR